MSKTDIWLGSRVPNPQRGDTELRSYDTARLISARPFTIVLYRKTPGIKGDVALPPQTVRVEIIESARNNTQNQNALMEISEQYVEIIGLKGHPSLPNTNILRADWFMYGNRRYEIVDVIDTIPDRLLASAKVTP